MPTRRNPTAQLIADNICDLHTEQGQMKLVWLASEQQEPIRYAIGAGVVHLLKSKGLLAGTPPAINALLERWESIPALRRGPAAKELREALGL